MSIFHNLARILIVALAALLLAPVASAQDIYLKANIGYGFGTSASGLGALHDDKYRYMSLGAGFLGGAGLGYYFTDNLAVELGINYHLGRNFKSEQTENFTKIETEYRGSGLQLTPCVVITTGRENSIAPYARIGMLVGLLNQVNEVSKQSVDLPVGAPIDIRSTEEQARYYGGVGLGAVAALGVDYVISDNLIIFSELQLTSFAYRPAKGELKVSKVDDVDRLPTLEDREKSWEYTNNINDVKPGENNKRLTDKFPFGAIGINFGVKFGF
jgi:opacity protein-like surface antigen